MNADDLRVLAERADGVEGRPDRRLDEVRARIDRVRRQRVVGAVVATVVAVVLALTAGTAVVRLSESAPPPAKPPTPTPTPTPKVDDKGVPAPRRLVYAKGSKIHLGPTTVDPGGTIGGLMGTDDGAVFTLERKVQPAGCSLSSGGCADLYFTDGTDIVHIGRVLGTYIRGYRIDVSSTGSTVVWFEPARDARGRNAIYRERGEYVVYDTRERREVARLGSIVSDRNGHLHLKVHAVFDDSVYWTPGDRAKEWCSDYSKYVEACRRTRSVMRLDTVTGEQIKVPWSAYVSDRQSREHLFLGRTDNPVARADNPFPYNHPGAVSIDFGRAGDRLVPQDENGNPVPARMAPSGEPIRLRLPAGYPDPEGTEVFGLHMWLGDDKISLNSGDLLVCRLPHGRCRVTVEGPLDYGFGGHG